jgi:hypothetical protein
VLVDTPDDLPAAIRDAERLKPEDCRAAAERRFSAHDMIEHYFDAYRRLAAGQPLAPFGEAA